MSIPLLLIYLNIAAASGWRHNIVRETKDFVLVVLKLGASFDSKDALWMQRALKDKYAEQTATDEAIDQHAIEFSHFLTHGDFQIVKIELED